MANVSKDRDRSGYRVKWRDPSGKHKTESGFRTRREALTRRDEINSALRSPKYVDPQSGNATFRAVAQDWLKSKTELKRSTRAGYEAMLTEGKELDKTFGDWPVSAITRHQVQTWVNGKVDSGRSPTTVRNYYFIVRQVLGHAVVDDMMTSNPCEHVKLPRARKPQRVGQDACILTETEVDRLAVQMPWPYDVLVMLAASTGMRAGELAGLRVGDVDLAQESVLVERSVISVNRELKFDVPKNKKARVVPLVFVEAMRAYLARHPHSGNREAQLFPNLRSPRATDEGLVLDWETPLRHSELYRRAFKPARKLAGVPERLRFHDLRHTFPSLAFSWGLDVQEISRIMGHSNTSITLTIYTHQFDRDRTESARRLRAGWGAARPAATGDNVVQLRPRGA